MSIPPHSRDCPDPRWPNRGWPIQKRGVLHKPLLVVATACMLSLAVCAELVALETDSTVPQRIQPYPDGAWPVGDARAFGFHGAQLDAAIDEIGQQDGVYGVLVVRGGTLIAERYFREGSRTKAHNLKSSSKSIISALIGILLSEGKLSLDDSVVERLRVRGLRPDRESISVRDLLRMASGLTSTSYETYAAWIASSDWVQSALALPLLHEPGTRYQYSTGNTHLLSALVRQASGMSTRAFAEQRLLGPLGIKVLGWETDPSGIHVGGNNLALLPRDMARFGELYLRGGVWSGEQLVPSGWVRESTSVLIEADHELYGDYGYQWFVPSAKEFRGDFIAVGYGGQYIYVSPRTDTVLVVTSTLESKGRTWERQLFGVLQGELLRGASVHLTSVPSVRPTRLAEAAPGHAEIVPAMQAELDGLQAELDGLRVRLQESTVEEAAMQSQMDGLARQLSQQTQTLNEQASQLAEQRTATDRWRSAAEASGAQVIHSAEAQAGWEAERQRWDAARQRLERAASDQQTRNLTLEREIKELLGSVADLRRREALAQADAEKIATSSTQTAREAAAERSNLLAQLVEAQSAGELQGPQLEAMQVKLDRFTAAQRSLAQQMETEMQALRSGEEKKQLKLETTFAAERDQLSQQLLTEQSRADQAIRELRKARSDQRAASKAVADLERSLAEAAANLETARAASKSSGEIQHALRGLTRDLDASRSRLIEVEAELETTIETAHADRARLDATNKREVAEVRRLSEALNGADEALVQLRATHAAAVQSRADLVGQVRSSEITLQQRSEENQRQALELGALTQEVERLRTLSQASEAALIAEQARTVARDELTARLRRSENTIQLLREELAQSKNTAVEPEWAELQNSYQALVEESQMLARRSGEQAERIATLERLLRSQPNVVDGATNATRDATARRLKTLLAEVDRLLGDRRVGEVIRRDLGRLRAGLMALGKAM